MKNSKGGSKKSSENNLTNVIRYYPSAKEGLTSLQVNERIENKLVNVKKKGLSKTLPQIIFHNVFTFFNILLLIIAIALICVGSYTNLFFLVIISLNTAIGIYQENKARKMINSLKLLTSPTSGIIRDGKEEIISSDAIVLDDIVVITAGKEIPVDGHVVDGVGEVNESLLTGESVALKKVNGDQVLAGSFVVSGTIYIRAEEIGDNTYISKLQEIAKKQKKVKSVLLSALNGIIKYISIIIIPLGAIMLINSLIQKNTFQDAIAQTAGSMVSMIPSGLFLLVSTALYVSVTTLGKKNAMVQELYSIESLARSNVLCLDKTGTITDGTMHLTKTVKLMDEDIDNLVSSFLSAFKDSNLTSEALKRKYNQEARYSPNVTVPFSSDKKYSAVTFNNGVTYFLGAPEYLTKNKELLDTISEELKSGNRVLLFTKLNCAYNHDLSATGEVICYFVIEDHIRDDAFDTIKWFQDNDVELKVISGDNPQTICKIAQKVGIKNADKWISLENMPLEEVKNIALDYTIFGRVNPEQKAAIVATLKKNEKTVAMTGDGVNDILALKQANCSVAMASGSEAARNVSHIVLMDSSFSSMPKIVEEGRKVINNIQYSSSLFLMKTMYAILLSIIILILAIAQTGATYPFEPKHLYILEFAVIGIPSFFLALQPNKKLVPKNFFQNIIMQAIPGGLAILFSVLLVLYLEPNIKFFAIDSTNVISASCLALSITGLLILLKMCLPFNLYRGLVYLGMLIISALIIFVLPLIGIEIVNFNVLDWHSCLGITLSAFVSMAIYLILDIIVKKRANNISKLISNVYKEEKENDEDASF